MITGVSYTDAVRDAQICLRMHASMLNEMDDFGDTGIHMCCTLSGVSAVHAQAQTPLFTAADQVALAMAESACGSSGLLLALLFRGLAVGLTDFSADGRCFAAALRTAVEFAMHAAPFARDGALLTVASFAADASCHAAQGTVHSVLSFACMGAAEGLRRVSARYGRTDAGGCGLCLLLQAFSTRFGVEQTADIQIMDTAEKIGS